MHVPQVMEIKRIIRETNSVKTFIFDWEVEKESPGQFMMLWNFKDEKPMSLSVIDPVNNEIGFSIRRVGNFTIDVHSLQEGDNLGIRGPYGRGFEIDNSRILVVGGGIGMAPLIPYIEIAAEKGADMDVIAAATSGDELLFMNRIKEAGVRVFPCTDDGSVGFKGYATELAEKMISEESYNMVISCGPEVMMHKLWIITEKYQIPAQFSLERYMKCGIGICGQCCVDDVGWRVCVEGPVFWSDELGLISEFGHYRRDASGIKHMLI